MNSHQRFWLVATSILIAAMQSSSLRAERIEARPALAKFSDASFWTFDKFRGDGTMRVIQSGRGDILELSSQGDNGMAAAVHSLQFHVEPNRQYVITMDVKTEGLESIDASLTGSFYLQFWDGLGKVGGYEPCDAISSPAPENSEWHLVSRKITIPSTARTAQLYLAFAAFGPYTDTLRPRVSGRAKGHVWFRSLHIDPADRIDLPPPTIHVSDQQTQAAIDLVLNCLHNASINGIFVDSDGYSDSSNIVPDLSFGLYGIRSQGRPEYMRIIQKQWEKLGNSVDTNGQLPQRVMSQILFPIGVDQIYSFTGDRQFLAKMLPTADATMEFVNKRADQNGLVRLVDHGQWVIGEGADWVDWYPTRMEGKTFTFHLWYIRALRRMAELHEELTEGNQQFPGASVERARAYRERADKVEATLRRLYWSNDHFVTNIDFDGKIADQKWMDDQVWAIRFGLASPEQARSIWSWVDRDPQQLEGVPTAWSAFPGPEHGPTSWFGRTGAGDILARYTTGQPEKGLFLIKRIGQIFTQYGNVYESYKMDGTVDNGTLGWGNYTEHCGGFLMALLGGPFGVDFDSDHLANATIRPRFPEDWTHAEAEVYVRGTEIKITFNRANGKPTLSLTGEEGAAQPIRVTLPNGEQRIVRIGAGAKESFAL